MPGSPGTREPIFGLPVKFTLPGKNETNPLRKLVTYPDRIFIF
jgi:hypothetical protein